MLPTYYMLLGLHPNALPEDIKKAYREKALLLHPDKNRAADAHERFVEVNQAFYVLSDTSRRTAYDLYLANYSVQYTGQVVDSNHIEQVQQWQTEGKQNAEQYANYSFVHFSGEILSNLLAEGLLEVIWEGMGAAAKGTGVVLGEILSNIDL